MKLTRTVRFGCSPTGWTPTISAPHANGYAGWPAVIGLFRFEEFRVSCVGNQDPRLTYVIDIKKVDAAVREVVVPAVADAFARTASGNAVHLPAELAKLWGPLAAALESATPGVQLSHLRWQLSPFVSLEMEPPVPDTQRVAIVGQKFEFAASHRLHVPTLSPEENRRAFGKCNHPSGHGHNYVFEPRVEIPVDDPLALRVGELEAIAKETILDRFDHTYLNVDSVEFRDGSGLVPSVENIARVFYDLLAQRIGDSGRGARLRDVTVWESERTSATYPA